MRNDPIRTYPLELSRFLAEKAFAACVPFNIHGPLGVILPGTPTFRFGGVFGSRYAVLGSKKEVIRGQLMALADLPTDQKRTV